MESPEPSPRRRRNVLAGLEALEGLETRTRTAPPPVASVGPVGPVASVDSVAPVAPPAPYSADGSAGEPRLTGDLRSRIRRRGPLVALVPPVVLGIVAMAVLRIGTTAVTGATGFVLAVLGAPMLVVAGIPLRSGVGVFAIAIAASATLWALLGLWAARRAAARPAPRWATFWAEYAWMAGSVWAGLALSLLISSLAVGRILI